MQASDLEISWSESIGFEPLVGDYYWEGLENGLKVLLLGESHYDKDGDASRGFTIGNFVEFTSTECLEPASGFFGKVQRIGAMNADCSAAQAMAAWQRLAFMNFVQVPVGRDAKDRPTAAMWRTGPPALNEVLDKLRPDVVLVMGKMVWNRIHAGRSIEHPPIVAPRRRRELWAIPHGGGEAVCSWIYHPARSMESLTSAIAVFRSLMAVARDRKAG